MFKRLQADDTDTVTIDIEGRDVQVPVGDTVAAAVLSVGLDHTRTTPVSGRPRAPYCMMGLCFDCLMEIDGRANRQACMVRVADGMRIRRQHGAGEPVSESAPEPVLEPASGPASGPASERAAPQPEAPR